MHGARLLRQVDSGGARGEENIGSPSWRARSFLAGQSLRRCLERAPGQGACAVSLREFRDEHPDTPGRDRVSGPCNNDERETSCSRTKKVAEVSKRSVGSRQRDGLIREEVIGRRMRTGLRAGRGRVDCARGEGTLALFHQPAREHRAGIFIEPLIEQRSNFLTKVSGVTEPGKFVGLEGCSRSRQQKFPRRLCLVTCHRTLLRDRNHTITSANTVVNINLQLTGCGNV
jgi:hypothetical protein